MHRNTLVDRAEAAIEHLPIGFMARKVHARIKVGHPSGGGERFAGIEKTAEVRGAGGARRYRSEFYVAFLVACFSSSATVTDGESSEFTLVPKKHRVSEALCVYRTYFPLQVEPCIDRVR